MKLASLVITIASLVVCSFESASALSGCNKADAKKIVSLSNTLRAEPNCLKNIFSECPNDCLATLENVASAMPNCLYGDTNINVVFQELVTACKAASVGGSTTTSDSSTNSTTTSTTKTPSTTSSSTPSATVASVIGTTTAPTAAAASAASFPFSSASLAISSAAAVFVLMIL